MKIIDWNISYLGKANAKFDFLKKTICNDSAIIILQEVTKSSYEILKNVFENFNIEYSLEYRPPSKFDTKSRGLGVAIITTKDIEIISAKVLERCLFPDRTLLVEAKFNHKPIKILGLHSITGCDHKKAKSIQFYSFAEVVDTYKPDIVAFDANEPQIDNYIVGDMVFFDNKDKGKGAETFFNTLVDIGLKDAYATQYNKNDFCLGEPLVLSHKINNRFNKRYDFIFINDKLFDNYKIKYNYDDSIAAGSDHALIEIIV